MDDPRGPRAPSPADGEGAPRGRRRETLGDSGGPPERADAAPEARPATGAQEDSRSLSPTDSPCVALCSTLYDDVCRGCGRTVFEVANWVFMDEAEKREVWDRIRAQGFPRKRPAAGRHAPDTGAAPRSSSSEE